MVLKSQKSVRCPQCGMPLIAEADNRLVVKPSFQAKRQEVHQLLGRIKCNRCKGQLCLHYKSVVS